MRFVDEVEIIAASGKGGDGAVTFRREAHVPRGGPDGGDGGRGGSLVLEATHTRNTLVDYRDRRIHRADDGQPGGKQKMYGRAGADKVLPVPIGTLVYDAASDELLADLDHSGAQFVLPGGKGGKGNFWFRTATRQTPMFSEPGGEGVETTLRLELKLIADVGLLGFPNAGKSTLISRISAARPKVADYPFTTLTPNLGVVSVAPGDSFVVADIPGLIEGAAEGRGLGHQFLRHVERCELYLHLVSPDEPDTDPVEALGIIERELEAYDPELLERPRFVVVTKTDLLPDDEREALVERVRAAAGTHPVFAISAATGDHLQELVYAVWHHVRDARESRAEHSSRDSGPLLP